MSENAYKLLAQRLNELPNGYPPTEDGTELRLLSKLYTPEEAALASTLRITLETPGEIVKRMGPSAQVEGVQETKKMLKGMARKGLIKAGKTDHGMGFGLMPFVVGIYEMQIGRIDEELAQLFEDYHKQAFGNIVAIQPSFHRVVPIGESVRMDMEVRPYESATEIVNQAQSWGVMDCICRKQKALVGDPCDHPLDVCMVFSPVPNTFDHSTTIRALTHQESLSTLNRAAKAGLVHSVSNNQEGNYYICNCCTCSCGLLRGMAELGLANVVARSVFVNTVDSELCMGCEDCIDYCQFDALELADALLMTVDPLRCVGCGVCVPACPENAMSLVRRPEEEITPPPVTEQDWLKERAESRGIDISTVM